jgi:hypothetical protein
MKPFIEYFYEAQIPKILIGGIEKSPYYAKEYAKFLVNKGEEVPESIINAVAIDIDWTLEFTEHLIKNKKPVPPILHNRIVGYKYREYLGDYYGLLYVYHGELSEEQWNVICSNPPTAYRFVRELHSANYPPPVPEKVLDVIAADRLYASRYYDLLLRYGLVVPEKIRAAVRNR